MKIVFDILQIHKCFRVFSFHIARHIFCFTLLWYYNERYDDGKGLFRLRVGKFIECRGKSGIQIELLRFSWKRFKKSQQLRTV